jgi:hypothetical protein
MLVFNNLDDIQTNEDIDELVVPLAFVRTLTAEKWQYILKEKVSMYEYVLLVNSVFNETHTISGMAIADYNIVCMDTRLTPAKHIVNVDLLRQEYQIPSIHFAINRVGYNPSFIQESIQFAKQTVALLTKIKIDGTIQK